MIKSLQVVAAALLATTAITAAAQVSVSEPWIRATVPSQMATGAFMKLTAASNARLIGAASPVAGVVEVHEMALENNVMRMRAVTALDLPAGKPVELKPGGYHVMLLDLKRQLKPGETVPVTLQIEQGGKRQEIEVQATVRALGAGAMKKH
jgi:copper(I)-binding protein